ncbi:hypothetical protein ACO0QE_001595 [Hanseniaspora vineae]
MAGKKYERLANPADDDFDINDDNNEDVLFDLNNASPSARHKLGGDDDDDDDFDDFGKTYHQNSGKTTSSNGTDDFEFSFADNKQNPLGWKINTITSKIIRLFKNYRMWNTSLWKMGVITGFSTLVVVLIFIGIFKSTSLIVSHNDDFKHHGGVDAYGHHEPHQDQDLFSYYTSWLDSFYASSDEPSKPDHKTKGGKKKPSESKFSSFNSISENYGINIFKYFKIINRFLDIKDSDFIYNLDKSLESSNDEGKELSNGVDNYYVDYSNKEEIHHMKHEPLTLTSMGNKPGWTKDFEFYSEKIKEVFKEKYMKAVDFDYFVDGEHDYKILKTESLWLPQENVFFVSSIIEYSFTKYSKKIVSNHVLMQLFDENYQEVQDKRLFNKDFYANTDDDEFEVEHKLNGKIEELVHYLKFIDEESNVGNCDQYLDDHVDHGKDDEPERMKFDKCIANSLKNFHKFESYKENMLSKFSLSFPAILDIPQLGSSKTLKKTLESLPKEKANAQDSSSPVEYFIGPQDVQLILDSVNQDLHIILTTSTDFYTKTTKNKLEKMKMFDIKLFNKVNSFTELTNVVSGKSIFYDSGSIVSTNKQVFTPLFTDTHLVFITSLASDNKKELETEVQFLQCSLEDGVCFNSDLNEQLISGSDSASQQTIDHGFQIMTNFIEVPRNILFAQPPAHPTETIASKYFLAFIKFDESRLCDGEHGDKFGTVIVESVANENSLVFKNVAISKPWKIPQLENKDNSVTKITSIPFWSFDFDASNGHSGKRKGGLHGIPVTSDHLGLHIMRNSGFSQQQISNDETNELVVISGLQKQLEPVITHITSKKDNSPWSGASANPLMLVENMCR